MESPVVVWFRLDFRVDDNPALHAAIETGAPIIPLYIWSPEEEGKWPPGAASQYWLHHALLSLQQELENRGSKLILRKGTILNELVNITTEFGAKSIFWNRCYEPAVIKRDSKIKKALKQENINVQSFNGHLLFEPHQISNKQGGPFKVYTPFWKHYRTLDISPAKASDKKKYTAPAKWPGSLNINEFGFIPGIKWYTNIEKSWDMSLAGVKKRIKKFINDPIQHYQEQRDYPATDGISRMSPYLHFGQISSRRIWHLVVENEQKEGRITPSNSAEGYLRQLVWREFAYHLLFHFPQTNDQPLLEKFKKFPWKDNKKLLTAWQRGETGYPIVDAGMRELWQSGWMHNRVRMIVGSFLTKDLLISWQNGAVWFWDTLVDADLANNTMGWQWVAGCGADAAPYFRIFNPVTQATRFDPDGNYIRRWIPELGKLDNKYIHQPWQAPESLLRKSGIKPGKTYPAPVVDHAEARDRALASYQSIKQGG